MADIHFCECPVCEGAGTLFDIARGRGYHVTCDACDGRGEVSFVPLARVLEIVEERCNMWGAMLSDARTGGPAMGHAEAKTILRLLREEFEQE